MSSRVGVVLSMVLVFWAIVLARDVRTYAFRWQSSLTLEQPSIARPDISALVQPRTLRPAVPETPAVTRLLDYDCHSTVHLGSLVRRVTAGASNDVDRGLRWVAYVQHALVPTATIPTDGDGTAIYHPLHLLELQRADCSQTARVVVDGLVAIGVRARLLQLNGHVSAEFWAQGKWRFAEADILADGEFVADVDGQPASVDDILRTPALLDSVHPYAEVADSDANAPARFRAVFAPIVYQQSPLATPYVIRKMTPPDRPHLVLLFWFNDRLTAERQWISEHHHGWNHYVFCPRDEPDCSN